jgi:tRNA (adenine57-N1/adenine58-N1)-methyltransferase
MSRPFEPGERVLLIDDRGRRYLFRLSPGETWHSHAGAVPHDLILGSEEGTWVHSTSAAAFVCFRPRLTDFVLKMPRGAQVVYPKDLGAIWVAADIFPGASVLEGGTGSGALTIALSRAVGPEGRVVSYDTRPEFQEKALRNLEAFFGGSPGNVDLRGGDLAQIAETGETFDRAVLDLPEPWAVLPAIDPAIAPGGIVCGYLPTTVQIQRLVLAFNECGYQHTETFEVLHRSWHVTERSVRPDHRMVAHTGFITLARKGARAEP